MAACSNAPRACRGRSARCISSKLTNLWISRVCQHNVRIADRLKVPATFQREPHNDPDENSDDSDDVNDACTSRFDLPN